MALGIERMSLWKKQLRFVVIPVLFLSIALTSVYVFLMREKTVERTAVYSEVDYLSITNAIVFLARTENGCSGDMPCGDLTRNGISFDKPVLYVHYRGAEENLGLMRQFPERGYYYWHCDKIRLEKIPVLDFTRAKNEHCLLIKIDSLEVEESGKSAALRGITAAMRIIPILFMTSPACCLSWKKSRRISSLQTGSAI